MKLKKCNAVISLLTFIAMLLHMGYSAFAYLTFYYNPTLKSVSAIPFSVLVCIHAVLGMCAVFLLSDGTSAQLYPKKNIGTVVQRITAALIFPLLLLHINTYSLLKETSASGQYFFFTLLIIAQIIFYAVIVIHSAVSFSRALITLGALASVKAKKAVDIIVYLICAVTFAVASFAVVKGQLVMFLAK